MGIRIGIHTGPVVAGLLGGSERLKYTTVGDTVNIAARLESYDKTIAGDGLCRILVGDGTSQYLNSHYETEEVGTLVLKGKGKTVKAYRVVSGRDATSDPVVEEAIQWIS
jgi:adenylate cyclase